MSVNGKTTSEGQAQRRLSVEDTGPGTRQDQLSLDSSPSSAPVPVAPGRGVRILTVDDDTDQNRQVLDEQLTSLGVLHTSVASAHEALTALREAQATGEPFDIAIVDAVMGMNGEALGQAIRAVAALQHTALVLRGSAGDPADAKRLERAGFAGYLVKPASQSQLVNTLMTALGAYRNDGARDSVTQCQGAEPAAAQLERWCVEESPIGGMRVLLVEDNEINQDMVAAMLEVLGYRADVAANGQEALEILDLQSYDLVLMDCQMPEMDGYSATAEIRRRQSGKRRVPIIAMTAHAMRGERDRCLAAGMDDYISKPIRMSVLKTVLGEWAARLEAGWQGPSTTTVKPESRDAPHLRLRLVR